MNPTISNLEPECTIVGLFNHDVAAIPKRGRTPYQANYDGSADPYQGGGSKGEYRRRTVPVDSFGPNPWGLYNVHGNVKTMPGAARRHGVLLL